MTPDTILAHPARVLTQTQREFYFEEGYLCLPAAIDADWLARLRAGIDTLVERSRTLTGSDRVFDLEAGHTAAAPRLRRIAFLDDLNPLFWEFAADSVLTDIAADLLGPDVTFRESMINYKWAGGGQAVKWHQDIPFYPHTNLSAAQFLVALEDVGAEQGPLQVIPRSHRGEIYEHYDDDGCWLGHIPEARTPEFGAERAVELTGPAGTVTVHHSAMLHSSRRNDSERGRPVIINGYNSADALPYTAPAYRSSHMGSIVRGAPSRCAQHDPLTLRLPPDWSAGYTSIFRHQAGEEGESQRSPPEGGA